MKQTHTLITIVIAVILTVLFGFGYVIMITPNDKQAKIYDRQRESDFQRIHSGIVTYYNSNNKLPETLLTLNREKNGSTGSETDGGVLGSILSSFAGIAIRDPQTNKEYAYKYENQSSRDYQLCAKFAKANEEVDKEVAASTSSSSSRYSSTTIQQVKHGAGDQCVKFTVPEKKKQSNYVYPDYTDELTEQDQQRLRQELLDQLKASPTPTRN